jgi:DMATS type aromatic prenyltransferase
VSSIDREGVAQRSLLEFGSKRLTALCRAAGEPQSFAEYLELFEDMLRSWGNRRIGATPLYPSQVADDEAPYEFAIAVSEGAPELQFYVDPLGKAGTLRSNMRVARGLLERLAAARGVPLARLRLVEDLFFPRDPQPPFALWIGASAAAGRPIKLKAYLNPQVRGAQTSVEVVAEALRRLGFQRAWERLRGALCSPGRAHHDELAILSLDLSNAESARAKVYIRHHHATASELATIAAITGEHSPDQVLEFYSLLSGGQGPFTRKPPITEHTFMDADKTCPSATTLEFPIGGYVDTDATARRRVLELLKTVGLPALTYDKALHALALRPLAEGRGIHAHVTLRRDHGSPRVGVYFASEAYLPRTRGVAESTPPSASYQGP